MRETAAAAISTPPERTTVLTALALIAFAANSLLSRWAPAGEVIGPVAFTGARPASESPGG